MLLQCTLKDNCRVPQKRSDTVNLVTGVTGRGYYLQSEGRDRRHQQEMVQCPQAGNSKEWLTPLNLKARGGGRGVYPYIEGCLTVVNPANLQQPGGEEAGKISISTSLSSHLPISCCACHWQKLESKEAVSKGQPCRIQGREGSWRMHVLRLGTAFKCALYSFT